MNKQIKEHILQLQRQETSGSNVLKFLRSLSRAPLPVVLSRSKIEDVQHFIKNTGIQMNREGYFPQRYHRLVLVDCSEPYMLERIITKLSFKVTIGSLKLVNFRCRESFFQALSRTKWQLRWLFFVDCKLGPQPPRTLSLLNLQKLRYLTISCDRLNNTGLKTFLKIPMPLLFSFRLENVSITTDSIKLIKRISVREFIFLHNKIHQEIFMKEVYKFLIFSGESQGRFQMTTTKDGYIAYNNLAKLPIYLLRDQYGFPNFAFYVRHVSEEAENNLHSHYALRNIGKAVSIYLDRTN